MQVDWITVSAQIINFLILVYLLKRFLYQPVMTAMNRREQRIADRLNEARKREQEAEREADQYRDEKQELEQRRDELLNQAREEAKSQRQELLDDAREEVAEVRRQWQQEVEREKQEFLKGLKQQTAKTIARIVRQVLADLADAGLERQVINKFLDQLDSLDEQARKQLTETRGPLRITTAFELTDEQRSRIRDALHERLGPEREIHFARAFELLCGIELSVEGYKLSWTVDDYLQTLEDQIEQALASARS